MITKITKESISKILTNVKNDQMLNILAEHIRLTASCDKISRFIEMCLCDNNEIKLFIKTKDDFNKTKIIEVINKLIEYCCVSNIKYIDDIDWLTGNISVTYEYYKVTYHTNQDFSDEGLCWKTEENKYANIHINKLYTNTIVINYYTNNEIMY